MTDQLTARRTIERVTSRADLDRWQSVWAAAYAHDFAELPADPVEERYPDVDGTTPDDGGRAELWVAQQGESTVAAAMVGLSTMDNTKTASIDLHVHPEHRRQGHGRALLTALIDGLVEQGRTRVLFEVPSPYPDGPAPLGPLLTDLGARPVLREVRRTVDLHAHPVSELPTPPPGYRLHQWEDAAPDDLVEGLAVLKQRMSTDAPLEEMDWEPEVWDAARYRAEEETVRLRGRRRVTTAVQHDESGAVAGFTEIAISGRLPEISYQWATLVLPEHRGHALGMLLKAHNHQQVAQLSPATRWVNTWNAESNTYMVSVNEALGYEPREWWTGWQLDR